MQTLFASNQVQNKRSLKGTGTQEIVKKKKKKQFRRPTRRSMAQESLTKKFRKPPMWIVGAS